MEPSRPLNFYPLNSGVSSESNMGHAHAQGFHYAGKFPDFADHYGGKGSVLMTKFMHSSQNFFVSRFCSTPSPHKYSFAYINSGNPGHAKCSAFIITFV